MATSRGGKADAVTSRIPTDPERREGDAVQAVILCGGPGTRLREETEFKPKPMVKIGDRPILWHIMRHYRQHGVREFILCLGYKGDVIRDYFFNYSNYNRDFAVDLSSGTVTPLGEDDSGADWRVVLVETGDNTQTGSRIKQALKYLTGERFFATYGDGVADVDLAALLRYHRASKRLATVTAVRPSSRFGEISIGSGLVQSFQEKPQVADGWINGGFFVFDKQAFASFPSDQNLALETGLLGPLAGQQQLAVYQHNGFWQCMDTFREMKLLNDLWAGGQAPWRTWI